jgi:ketosteroid isomerase-like protein
MVLPDHPRLSAVDIAIAFNECINRRDLGGLTELMTEDHMFTDTTGASVRGKAACIEAWRGFFAQFPDYRNTFDNIRSRGDMAIAIGSSTCSVEVLNGPAIWTSASKQGRVSHWRVYEDTASVRADLDVE